MSVYVYTCKNCGSRAEKTPCKKGEGTASLGSWRCPRCGPTKVSRTK